MTTVPSIQLNDGHTIPQIGLGTALDNEAIVPVIVSAIEAGFRHIDTAYRYGNQRGVGRGIRDSGIARDELFITSKLDGEFQGGDRALPGLDLCLSQLDTDYVDLLLIHWPLPQRDDYVSTWQSFKRLVETGKTRSIGVSNFKPAHLERLSTETGTVPAVNQIQLNPRITRPDQLAYHRDHGIVTAAWSPLGSGSGLREDPTLAEIATRHGKTPTQIILRWEVQLGVVPVPRSTNPVRMRENLDVFDFALTAEEIALITALDTGAEPRVDSDSVGH